MNIVICDDERLILDDLEWRIKRYTNQKDIPLGLRRFEKTEALLAADLSECDILLLDVDMPGIDGIEAARRLRKSGADMILIFVTGFLEYATKGYEVDAFRYILKGRLAEDLPRYLDDARRKLYWERRLITVRTREQKLDVAQRNILYFEGTSRRRVLMYLKKRTDPVECLGKLNDFDAELTSKDFVRLQRSYLANMGSIDWINNYYAKIHDGPALKISERRYGKVKTQFLEWKGMSL